VDARETAHERGLPGAVVADEGGDLAAAHPHRRALERVDAAEGLRDVAGLEEDVVGHGGAHFFW
jgi:hypothetical protein